MVLEGSARTSTSTALRAEYEYEYEETEQFVNYRTMLWVMKRDF